MKVKQEQGSDFDIKKWGFFFLFLGGLGLVLFLMLKPEGEGKAQQAIDDARLQNRKAREMANLSNSPQDLANLDLSTDALEKASALFIELEFTQAFDEAQKAMVYARKVTQREEPGNYSSQISFTSIYGEALVKKRGSNDFELATPRMDLGIGDEVRTQASGGCTLTHKDGISIMVFPNTRLLFQEGFAGQNDGAPETLYLNDGTISVRTTDRLAQNKFVVASTAGKVFIYPETETDVTFRSSVEEMRADVRFGRVDARINTRTVVLSSDQRLSFTEASTATVGESILPAPALLAPGRDTKFKVNANGFAPVALRWESVRGSDGYHLQLARDPVFADRVVDKKNYRGTRDDFSDLTAGEYFWRVASRNGNTIDGMFSQGRRFEVVAEETAGALGGGQPPALVIDRALVQGMVAIINGNTDRDATVKLNGEVALVNKDTGEFSHVLKMPGYGNHVINIVAESSTGTIAFKNITVKIKE